MFNHITYLDKQGHETTFIFSPMETDVKKNEVKAKIMSTGSQSYDHDQKTTISNVIIIVVNYSKLLNRCFSIIISNKNYSLFF